MIHLLLVSMKVNGQEMRKMLTSPRINLISIEFYCNQNMNIAAEAQNPHIMFLASMLVDLWGEEDVLNVYTSLQKCDVGGVFEGNVIYYAKRVEQLQVLIYGLGSEV